MKESFLERKVGVVLALVLISRKVSHSIKFESGIVIMGCSASKDGRRSVREHDDVTQKKNGGGRNNRRPSLEELEAKEEQQRKRLLMEEAALEQKLQELSLPMFNSGSSTEDLTRLSKVELLAMDKIRRKQRREAAMENASKDRKWMVFSYKKIMFFKNCFHFTD